MALPEIKDKQSKDDLSNQNKSQGKFFDRLLMTEFGKDKISSNRDSVNDFMERNKGDDDQKRMIRRIATNTDEMVLLLRKLELEDQKKNGFDLKSLLPLLPLLSGLAFPELTKGITAALKSLKLGTSAIKAADAAATAAKATKTATDVAKAAKVASSAADVAGTAGKAAKAVGIGAKTLGTLGKFGDSKIVNKGIRWGGAGMIGANLLEGDYLGAGLEGASLAAHEASRKVKSPKAKAALTALSLGTDGLILARDFIGGKKNDKSNVADGENGEDNSSGNLGAGTIIGAGALATATGAMLYAKKKGISKTPDIDIAPSNNINKNINNPTKINSIIGPVNQSNNTNNNTNINKNDNVNSSKINSIIGPNNTTNNTNKLAPVNNNNNTSLANNVSNKVTPKYSLAPPVKSVASSVPLPSNLKDIAQVNGVSGAMLKGSVGTIAKGGAKLIPGVGLAMGAVGAVNRASKGDYVGAAGEAVSGLASLIPGIGTMASLAISAGLSYRDSQKANSEQLKKSVQTMEKTTATNKAQVDTNNEMIKKTSGAMSDNAKGVKKSMGVLSKTLVGFTTLFGGALIGWLSDSSSIFKNIFSTLTTIGGKLGGYLKEKWNQFTGNDSGGSTDGYSGKVDNGQLRSKLGKGDISGERLGAVSQTFESGNRGVGTISTGKGDHGGQSYGKHQMTAKTMTSFLNSPQGEGYKNQFKGLKPGTAAFNEKYKEVSQKDGNGFANAQKSYIDKEYYGVAYQDILKKTGMDVNKRGRALQELVYSTAVQYGPYSIGKWLNSLYGKKVNDMSDAAIITAIQNYKIKNNDTLMKSSSKAVRKGVADRAATEKEMLLNINQKNKGTGGADNLTAANKVANPTAQNTKATSGTATRKLQDESKGIVKNANAKAESKTPGIGVLKPGADPSVAKTSSNSGAAPTSNVKDTKNSTPGIGVLKPGADPSAAKVSSSKESSGTAAAKPSEKEKAKGKAEWDLDKLASVAVAKAKGRKATGKCALFVREALQAAGLKNQVSGGLGDANQFPNSLTKIGWVTVGQNIDKWQKGDISVFMKTGSEKGKKYGHVAIWSGSVWVSDHIQKGIQPNASLGNFPYSIWRAKNGISNGSAVSATAVSDELAKADDGTSVSGASEDNSEDKSPFDIAINAVTGGIASLAAAFGNMDIVKDALNWVNSAKVDKPFQRKADTADLTGFNMDMPASQGEYKYKFGEGGDYKESELFGTELVRQEKGKDVLGEAGKIQGIVRQEKGSDVLGDAGRINGIIRQLPGHDVLGEAGKIHGIVRQQPGHDVLGEAGKIHGIVRQGTTNKSKKPKWWERLFGSGTEGDLFKGLADVFGLGGVYDFGKTIAETSKNGNWDGALEKAMTPVLTANTEEKEKVDGYISELNKEYMNPPTPSVTDISGPETMPNVSLAKGGKQGNIDGMSSSIVTRNPDSIFREVSIAMMKASTT